VLARLLVQNWIAMPSPLFRREDALAVGGLDESLWYTPDWDFWLKLAALGPTRYFRRAMAAFRVHAGSQTVTRGVEQGAIHEQCRIVQERHFVVWQVPDQQKRIVRAVAELSSELNGLLAERLRGGRIPWGHVLLRLAARGPEGWWRFWRDTRLTERVAARLRAGLGAT